MRGQCLREGEVHSAAGCLRNTGWFTLASFSQSEYFVSRRSCDCRNRDADHSIDHGK